MFSRLNINFICSILILLIFASTSAYGVTCGYYQKICGNYPNYWCCESYQYCGSYSNSCNSYTTPSTPSSNLPAGLLTAIVIVPILLFVVCLTCCIHSQQQQRARSSVITTNAQILPHPYQQQPIRGPVRVVHARSGYNVNAAPPYPTIYEDAPPSYEVSVANFHSKYPFTSSSPVTATIEQTNLPV